VLPLFVDIQLFLAFSIKPPTFWLVNKSGILFSA